MRPFASESAPGLPYYDNRSSAIYVPRAKSVLHTLYKALFDTTYVNRVYKALLAPGDINCGAKIPPRAGPGTRGLRGRELRACALPQRGHTLRRGRGRP